MITSADWMHTLAWSLLHFLWQGAAIATLAAALMLAVRKPGIRYLVGVGALGAMMISFMATFALLSGSAEAGAHAALGGSFDPSVNTAAFSAKRFIAEQVPDNSPLDFLWIARGWLIGVSVLALRIGFGLLVLEQLRRRNLIALPAGLAEKFRALQSRLGIRRVVRFSECQLTQVPAVIGFLRPIVLVPMRALLGLSAEQLEAVIAHELAHIKRFDVAVNFFQVIAETLFFFHPAVWWLNKRIRADREDCCDDVAVAACGGTVSYARALATMESWRGEVPAFAMAATGGSVTARVARLLGVKMKDPGARSAGVVTASLMLVCALIAGAFSIGVANTAQAQASVATAAEPSAAPESPPVPAPAPEPAAAPEPVVSAEPAVVAQPVVPPVPVVAPVRVERPQRPERPPPPVKAPRPEKPLREPKPPREPSEPRKTAANASYIEEMNAAGLGTLDVDTLIAMRSQDVTPEYVRAIRAAGLTPDANMVIAMKSQDVSPEYIQGLRSLGFKPDANEVIAMKATDVSPEFVKSMRDLGIQLEAGEFIAMKSMDMTPEYVRQMRASGINASANDLIALKSMDVTPEFIAKANAQGFKDLSAGKLIELKNSDIL
jgi:beta-lactamase regulating signal transducer with metallopeptidase domain